MLESSKQSIIGYQNKLIRLALVWDVDEVLNDWSRFLSAIDGPWIGPDSPKYVPDVLRIHLRRSVLNIAISKLIILPKCLLFLSAV